MPETYKAIILFKYTSLSWSKFKTQFKYFSRTQNEMSMGERGEAYKN